MVQFVSHTQQQQLRQTRLGFTGCGEKTFRPLVTLTRPSARQGNEREAERGREGEGMGIEGGKEGRE